MNDYVGEEKRTPPKAGDMSFIITGSKLPLVVLLGGVVFLISAVFGATVWFTKLDNRVYTNGQSISSVKELVVTQNTILSTLQKTLVKTTTIQESLIRRQERHENLKWHDDAGLEIKALKEKHKKE